MTPTIRVRLSMLLLVAAVAVLPEQLAKKKPRKPRPQEPIGNTSRMARHMRAQARGAA